MRGDYPFLYVDYFGILSFCNHMCAFTNHRYKEISDEVILSMEERKDYSKYEFKPLEPVLVRENKEVCWKLNFHSHYVDENKCYKFATTSGIFVYCIPYKGNEKLLNTNSDI